MKIDTWSKFDEITKHNWLDYSLIYIYNHDIG